MTADEIAGCLARNLFKNDLVVVDRCTWPGSECDLLVVTPRLQVVDVEIKISRADLKADRRKDKWYDWMSWDQRFDAQQRLGRPPTREEQRTPREWPRRVWKHYYAMPASLWKPELLDLCAPSSGVVVVPEEQKPYFGTPRPLRLWDYQLIRRAKPCRDYKPLDAAALRKIAYLASLRMWDAYADVASISREYSNLYAAQRETSHATAS